jgi:glycosyltransferase involved in cell wall biosynthesis
VGEFDVMHVHHFGRAALRLALSTKRPAFVFTPRDPLAMNGLAVGWKRSMTDGLVLRRADMVVALSNVERDFLLDRYGLEPARVAVIPTGIHTQIFNRRTDAPEGGEQRLLFAGQLTESKGLDYLLRALPAVRAANPLVKLEAVYQTDMLLERYQYQAERLGLNGTVEFAGSRTPAELAQLYSSAAVVVVPSLGECLSTVVMEAMCCGAAVATDVGGIREQLDEETGLIVPPRDSAALASAICRLLGDTGLRRVLGQAARHKAHAQFTVRKMIDRHVRLYKQLLGADECAA